MMNQETPNFQVSYIPSSFAFLTCIEVIEKTDSPTQIINLLSNIDRNKLNDFEQEYLKIMAINTAIEAKNISNSDVLKVLENFNVPFDIFSDLDYKMSSLITDEDLKMFDW